MNSNRLPRLWKAGEGQKVELLFLGLLYNREEEEIHLSRSRAGLQGAGNAFQWNLIDGLDEILPQPVRIMNSLPVGTYPRYYNRLLLPTKQWSHRPHTESARDWELGFINLPILKQISRLFLFYRKVGKWCGERSGERSGEDLFIIVYSLYLPYLCVLAAVKKKYKNVSACIIVPDLPNAFGFANKYPGIKKAVRRYLEKLQYQYAKAADSYVLLAAEMTKPLEIESEPYVVIEGICSLPENESRREENCPSGVSSRQEDLKIILYTGALNRRFGLENLLRAFQSIPQDNYRLWICGTGEYLSEIEKAAGTDGRIRYFGYVAAGKIHAMQKQATLLVNPRPDGEEYTKYSFPSKTLEYMASGRPVLMFKLEAIPGEYDDYLYYFKENTVESMKEAILAVTEKSGEELGAWGKAAYEFVMKHKNGRVQAKKIIDMLQNITGKPRAEYDVSEDLSAEERAPEVPAADCPNRSRLYKKTILQINITCQYGSTGRIAEQIHRKLVGAGCRSLIAYSALSSDLEGSFKIESALQNYLRRGLNRYLGRKYIHSAPGTLRLIRRIKRLKPDLIHLHNIQQNSVHFPLLLKFLKKYGVPVVYTLHDCWAFTGGCYHFTQLGCEGYKTGCDDSICRLGEEQRDICNRTTRRIYEEKEAALKALERLKIICVSDWLKGCAAQTFMKELVLQVIYNGTDTGCFRPVTGEKRKELGISGEEFVILGAANRWDNKKGLDTFTALARILDKPYRIVLVGLSREKCQENITAVPRTGDREELARLYSCADVFFQASREESFGLAAAEAMACGTPVIAYPSTACGEIITEDTGILLDTGSLEEVLAAIDTIRRNGKMKYTQYCAEHIRRNYSLEEMQKQYLNVYEQLLEPSYGNERTVI
jgi:glycosyltransferase involved in cell wall biosynthesis